VSIFNDFTALLTWAARCNTWLLIKLTPKGVVFSFLFLFFSNALLPGSGKSKKGSMHAHGICIVSFAAATHSFRPSCMQPGQQRLYICTLHPLSAFKILYVHYKQKGDTCPYKDPLEKSVMFCRLSASQCLASHFCRMCGITRLLS